MESPIGPSLRYVMLLILPFFLKPSKSLAPWPLPTPHSPLSLQMHLVTQLPAGHLHVDVSKAKTLKQTGARHPQMGSVSHPWGRHHRAPILTTISLSLVHRSNPSPSRRAVISRIRLKPTHLSLPHIKFHERGTRRFLFMPITQYLLAQCLVCDKTLDKHALNE